MNIGPSVKSVPPKETGRRGHGKYQPAYDAAMASPGEWVPVQFDTPRAAYRFVNAVSTHRTLKPNLEAQIRRSVVYLRYTPALKAVRA